MRNKRCILIGGAGFFGMNIARRLVSEGYNVTIVDRRPPPFIYYPDVLSKVTFHKLDYRDSYHIKKIIKDQSIIFHFACTSLPGTPFSKIEEDINENICASIKLFRLAAERGIKKIIFPSSGGTVYGDTLHLPIKETCLTNPRCFHGITKLMLEKYLFLFNKKFGINYLIYRISNLYGPGQMPNRKQGLIANAIYRMLKGLPIIIFGDGETTRDYIYIDDAVDAMVLGIKNDLKNDIFNIGTSKGYSINAIVKIISKLIGLRPQIVYSDKRLFDVEANILNIEKIKSVLSWKPEVDIEKGIQNTYRWIKKFSLYV